MKNTFSKLIAVTALLALTGCASTHISSVPDLGKPGARVGYIADGYCPSAATACEFLPTTPAAVDAFQKARNLDYIIIEAKQLDERIGTNVGLFFASAALGTPISVGSRIQDIIGIYDHGPKAEYVCDSRSQCRTEAVRLIANAQPAENGKQWSEEALARLATARQVAAEKKRKTDYEMTLKDIEYQKMLIAGLSTPDATPEAKRMKANAESKLLLLQSALSEAQSQNL